MSRESIPQELAELENRLRSRLARKASDGLRDRVMQAVRGELKSPMQSASSAGQSDGSYWAAIAVGVLIIMNLSMISASQSVFSVWSTPNSTQNLSEFQAVQLLEAQQEGMFK